MDDSQDSHSISRSNLRDRLRAEGIDLSDPLALTSVAGRVLAEGDMQAALDIVRFAVTLAPDDWRVLRAASGIMAEARDYRACDDLMKRVVKLAPDNAESHLHYAVVLIELREFARARKELDEHFRIAPDSDLGWRNLSTILACQGNYAAACDASERALEIDPSNREYAIHRVGLLIVLERVSDALQVLRHLDALMPDDPVVARLMSAAYEVAGDCDMALKFAEVAYKLAPDRLEYEQHFEHLRKFMGSIQAAAGEGPRRIDGRFPPMVRVQRSAAAEFLESLLSTLRVVFSILIREARTRFGGQRLGYAWAIFEPVSHLVLLAVVFAYMHPTGGAPIGDSLLVYYFTGVLLYLLLTNTIMHVQAGLESNRALLQIPIVKPLDVLVARAVLELLTEITVAVIMFSVFTVCGLNAVPHDIVRCLQAAVGVWFIGFGLGMVNGVILHFIRSWDHLFTSLTRALYFTSGIFFSTLSMPPEVRNILQWNPLLQAIDLFRSGFYPTYDPYWLNITYLYGFGIVTLAIGLGMERALRRKVSSPTW